LTSIFQVDSDLLTISRTAVIAAEKYFNKASQVVESLEIIFKVCTLDVRGSYYIITHLHHDQMIQMVSCAMYQVLATTT
jgi:hypothetical protein